MLVTKRQLADAWSGPSPPGFLASMAAPPKPAPSVGRSVDLAWPTDAIPAGKETCHMGVLAKLIEGLSRLFSNEAYNEADLVMRSVDLNVVSPEVMLAIARTSFAARHKLKGWKSFVARMRSELSSRGYDPGKLARGLG